jgi:hypothetical protein
MKKNMGTIDRLIRSFGAAVVVGLIVTHTITGFWSYILLGMASANLIASFVGQCPMYSLFGIKTCKKRTSPGSN